MGPTNIFSTLTHPSIVDIAESVKADRGSCRLGMSRPAVHTGWCQTVDLISANNTHGSRRKWYDSDMRLTGGQYFAE